MRSGAGRVGVGVVIVALVVGCVAVASAAVAKHPKKPNLSISVLSGRADLVSGGSALVAITLPARSDAKRVKVTVGRRNVTKTFAFRKDGRFEGLVTGLSLGRNTLQATLKSGWAAKLTLTSHPIGGPVFSGPQLKPWTCQSGATDRQCDQAPTFSYLYMSTNPAMTRFQPYNSSSPPSDVAQTKTDQGVKVPFIVRVETGYIDRDQYQIAALDQPRKPWTAVAPQAQFDHKLLIMHGSSCGVDFETGSAPGTTGSATARTALGKGFITMSTALDNSGHNCDLPLQAESLVMAKEHVIKAYGTLRYTIGTGCSRGSLAEQWIANAYPAVYQLAVQRCIERAVVHVVETVSVV